MAETVAYRFSLRLILTCHLRQVLVGAKRRPPRHMLPNAAWPERWVPPPPTRGIRATARPVPQDSAEVWNSNSKRVVLHNYCGWAYYLVTGFDVDGVGLTLVLSNRSVHTVHDIRPDRSLEDGGQRKSVAGWRRIARHKDVDLRTRRLHQKALSAQAKIFAQGKGRKFHRSIHHVLQSRLSPNEREIEKKHGTDKHFAGMGCLP